MVAGDAAVGADTMNPAVAFGRADRTDAALPVVVPVAAESAAAAAAVVPVVVLVAHRAAALTATAVPVMVKETGEGHGKRSEPVRPARRP
jgi:hypothetical protein